MLKGFKDFILRGNVVELAVAVIIGGAFQKIVDSLVSHVFTPLIGMLVGEPDFSDIMIGSIELGNFLNAVISFLLVAFAVYFFIVVPFKRLDDIKKAKEAAEAEAPAEPEAPAEDVTLLREIRDLLKQQKAS